MHLTTLPVLLTLTSLVPYALATPGYPVDALRNTFQGVINSPGFKDAVGSILHIQDKTEKAALAKRSPKTRLADPLPNFDGTNPDGDNPMGTKPCGTYATTATDGPCGAWFTAQYSIKPAVQTPTTLVTIRTTTVTLDFPQKTA